MGQKDESGNYTGSMGYLYRDEADISFAFVRSDAIDHGAVLLGPTLFEADIKFISKRIESHPETIPITGFFNDFDTFFYLYSLLIAIVIISIMTFMQMQLSYITAKSCRQRR